MTVQSLLADLSAYRAPNVFNPYRDQCPHTDRKDAASIRRTNLRQVLQAALVRNTRAVWIARDPGYRGARRTGIALTDEIHLATLGRRLPEVDLARSTSGSPMAEQTAKCVWSVLNYVEELPFLWNAFPFHPHLPNEPLTNRQHTRSEFNRCSQILEGILDLIRPSHVVAIGRDAERALSSLGLRPATARHPARGGAERFRRAIAEIYGIDRELG